MPGTDRSADLLRLLKPIVDAPGLKVVKVNTTDPFPLTFMFEGAAIALDLDIFEVPVDFYPLKEGDRLLAYQIAGQGPALRWGLLQKLNGGLTFATMKSATSLDVDGIANTYNSDVLILPPFLAVGNAATDGYLQQVNIRALKAGDRVSIVPTLDGDVIKYVVTQIY